MEKDCNSVEIYRGILAYREQRLMKGEPIMTYENWVANNLDLWRKQQEEDKINFLKYVAENEKIAEELRRKNNPNFFERCIDTLRYILGRNV